MVTLRIRNPKRLTKSGAKQNLKFDFIAGLCNWGNRNDDVSGSKKSTEPRNNIHGFYWFWHSQRSQLCPLETSIFLLKIPTGFSSSFHLLPEVCDFIQL